MISRIFRSCLLTGVGLGSLIVAHPAAAQGAGASAADEGDIIVTARRRQESILKVPVVETVLSGEQIANAQIKDLGNLATRVPGLNMGQGPVSIGPQISLRGIGTNALDQGIDQSISLNVDGLSMTQGLAYTAGLFDLAQAEVLKGPQALFFGKNSPGGVVALRSNDPGDELEVIGSLGYEFEAREKRAELILSTPVSDTFGVRLAGLGSFQDGFFHNGSQNLTNLAYGAQTPSKRFSKAKNFIVRGTALWKPTNEFTARLKMNYAFDYTDGDAGQGQRVDCPDGNRASPSTTAPIKGVFFQNPVEDCKLNRTIFSSWMDPASFPLTPHNGVPYLRMNQYFGTLELNYKTGDISLTSITGTYNMVTNAMINSINTGFAAPYYSAWNHLKRHDFTQELRIDSDFSSPLNFTAGAFYQKGQVDNHIELAINRALAPLPLFPFGYLLHGTQRLNIEAYSFFGQLRYQIVPQVELAAGVRWAHETRSNRVQNLNTVGQIPADISLPNRDKFTSSNYSPEATITWTPTDDLTIFGAFKQGYKSGSFTLVTPLANPHFGDERIRGGEIGLKARLADRQLAINLAGYDYKYKGLQVALSLTTPGSGIPIIRTQNAGGAKIYGVDFDFTYTPHAVEGLRIGGAINWNHARFSDFANAACINGQTIAEGCNQNLNPNTGLYTAQDLTGEPLPRGADWMGNATIDYEFPVSDNRIARLGLAGVFSSKYVRTLGTEKVYYQKAYGMLDANASYGAKDDSWQIRLIGRNIANKITAGSCTASSFEEGGAFGQQITGGVTNGPPGKSEFSCIARRGRELWVKFSIRR